MYGLTVDQRRPTDCPTTSAITAAHQTATTYLTRSSCCVSCVRRVVSCVSCCAAGCEKRTVPVGATMATAGPRWSSRGHGPDECGWHSGDHRLSSLSVSCLVLNEQPPSLLWMLLWSSVSLGLLLPSKPTMSTSSGTREMTVSPCVWGQQDTFIKHKTVHVGFQGNLTINSTHGMGKLP